MACLLEAIAILQKCDFVLVDFSLVKVLLDNA